MDASTLLTVSSLYRNVENVMMLVEIGLQEEKDDNFVSLKLVPSRQTSVRLIAPSEQWRKARLSTLWPAESYIGYSGTTDVAFRRSPSITAAFQSFRAKYLLVYIAVMLADGLQGEKQFTFLLDGLIYCFVRITKMRIRAISRFFITWLCILAYTVFTNFCRWLPKRDTSLCTLSWVWP